MKIPAVQSTIFIYFTRYLDAQEYIMKSIHILIIVFSLCYVNCFNSQKLNQNNKKISLLKASKVDHLLLKERSVFPRGDELDKRIFTLALPAVLNFALLPLVGAVDTFWIGRMKNALALAGQGAANQVFSSTFWIISFLPSVVTPLVAKSYGAGNQDEVKKNVGEALFIGMFWVLLV